MCLPNFFKEKNTKRNQVVHAALAGSDVEVAEHDEEKESPEIRLAHQLAKAKKFMKSIPSGNNNFEVIAINGKLYLQKCPKEKYDDGGIEFEIAKMIPRDNDLAIVPYQPKDTLKRVLRMPFLPKAMDLAPISAYLKNPD